MKVRSLVLTVAGGVLLTALTGVLTAQVPKAAPGSVKPLAVARKGSASALSVTHGTITSLDAKQLVLSGKDKGGKPESRTFMLDKETSKAGALNVGGKVTVHYRSDNNQLLATSIVGKPAKAKAAAKAPAHKG